ncbi:IS3 family transposase [Halovulum sp. GXIMD14794]
MLWPTRRCAGKRFTRVPDRLNAVVRREGLRHSAASPRDDNALRLALVRLAKQYGRYGYRKITELLHVEGWSVNHKKIER